MSDATNETAMIHFVCGTCRMEATCVHTSSAELAWLDHMANHAVKDNFRCYTWSIVPLELDQT